jgi:hypothetical protein
VVQVDDRASSSAGDLVTEFSGARNWLFAMTIVLLGYPSKFR